MDKEKVVTEEEESFLSLLLNNQTGYSLAVADALVGQCFEMHNENVAEVEKETPKQVESEPDEQQPIRVRKSIPPHVLRDLTVRDPKRARRIIANRMSAARAKEKKKLHIQRLENEVQNLQTEWNATSTQLAFVNQNEGQELTDESSRLKERVTMILQRISLQDELNEQIRKEVQYLKTTIGHGGGLNYNNAGDPQPDNGAQQ